MCGQEMYGKFRHSPKFCYKPKIAPPKFSLKNLLNLKSKLKDSTIALGDLNIPLSIKDKTTIKNINKKGVDLKNITRLADITNFYRTFL